MQDKQDTRIRRERELGEKAARVRFGSYEFKKKGVSRFDLRDPYHLAVALTWPQFLAALLALYLAVNIVFAALAQAQLNMGDPAALQQLAWQALENLRQQQAAALAFFDCFWIFAVVTAALVLVVPLMKRSVAEKGAQVGGE